MVQTLELILVRHGKAGARDPVKYPDDSERPLTEGGRKQMRRVAKGLLRILPQADAILTSPYVRAAQTAEILAPFFSPDRAVQKCRELSPGGSVKSLISHLEKMNDCGMIILVGHEPDLGGLAADLLGAGESDALTFKKGGCCRILFENGVELGAGKLVWWLTPTILRKLS